MKEKDLIKEFKNTLERLKMTQTEFCLDNNISPQMVATAISSFNRFKPLIEKFVTENKNKNLFIR